MEAVKGAARSHPAAATLKKVARGVPPPATILLLSAPLDSAEASVLEGLGKLRYRVLPLSGAEIRAAFLAQR